MCCHFLNLISNIASIMDSTFFYVVVITVPTITHYSLSVYDIVGIFYNAHYKRESEDIKLFLHWAMALQLDLNAAVANSASATQT